MHVWPVAESAQEHAAQLARCAYVVFVTLPTAGERCFAFGTSVDSTEVSSPFAPCMSEFKNVADLRQDPPHRLVQPVRAFGECVRPQAVRRKRPYSCGER